MAKKGDRSGFYKTCLVCSSKFYVIKSKLETKKFCCKKCYSKWLSKNIRGKKHNRFGKHHSKETKKKLSQTHKGRTTWIKGKKHTKETIKKLRESHLGYIMPESQKIKIGKANSGSQSHLWKGGITPEIIKIRTSRKMREWRKSVFSRDSFTCQICGDNKGGNLNAHHIKFFSKYPKLRFDSENGIALCQKCHIAVHSKNLNMEKLYLETKTKELSETNNRK